MEEMAIYLSKVSICLIILYVLYAAVLNTKTFFHFNRAYLLFALIVSFIIPAIHFSTFKMQYAIGSDQFSAYFAEPDFNSKTDATEVSLERFSAGSVMVFIYCIGVLLLAFRFIIFIWRVVRLKNRGEARVVNGATIVNSNVSAPFTFFNYIFLPEQGSDEFIIAHERVHVDQLHWIDLLIVEIVSIVLWVNPILLLYRRSIKLQHEYLADSATIASGISIEYYLKGMVKAIYSSSLPYPISQFYSNTIKKRIHMLTKTKTPRNGYLIYLIVLPVIGVLFLSFSDGPISTPEVVSPLVNATRQEENVPSILPVESKSVKIASNFGMRMHPTLHQKKFHTGVDLILPEGETVLASAKGVVVESSRDSQRGIYLLIKHSETFTTAYFHFKSVSVKKGDQIEKGQTIGLVGSTGLSTEPHLHYEVLQNGKPVDPANFFSK